MNILITGANGLLGKSLLQKLSLKHNIYAIVGKNNKLKSTDNIKILEIDLFNLNINKLPKNIDVIYYLAQSNHFREFPSKTIDMLNININAPVRLALWGKQNNIKKFIFVSSGGVYKHPIKPLQEVFEKNGFYLDSKLSAEILLRNFASFFETFVIVRPFFMYGPGQNTSMLIPRLINNVQDENEITLSYKNGIKINPIYVDDVSISMEKLLDLKGEYTFNIAGNEVVSLRELSEMIGIIVNKTPKYKVLDNSQSDLVADISKMKEKLCKPTMALIDGLERVYRATSR
ncbi:MAG: NAD-dependent epimerase [Arcobacter sp.]|nr:MAG: NAD-dependent epimerase [Arcobacter sp.]